MKSTHDNNRFMSRRNNKPKSEPRSIKLWYPIKTYKNNLFLHLSYNYILFNWFEDKIFEGGVLINEPWRNIQLLS